MHNSLSMKIEPRILKGFKDSLPEEEYHRKSIIKSLEQTFESFGFLPIDTPVMEYSEILLGKGGGETDKQVYRFLDHGQRDVTLRYDLTVPFARFMAAHAKQLGLPFRRYHMAKVWRGENTQKGRYREFMQCDFDIVGTDNTSSDFEILLLMLKSLQAIGISKFKIHIAHRGVFNAYLTQLNLNPHAGDILRIVDKLKKIGRDKISELLAEFTNNKNIECILEFINPVTDFEAALAKLKTLISGDNPDLKRLEDIYACISELKLQDSFILDTSITRGLDYYTGIVFETFLSRLPDIGSVCSGGRYNNLASLYTKEIIPGVGASIGLDRLLAALTELTLPEKKAGIINLIVLCLDEKLTPYYHSLALYFRENRLKTEVYPLKRKMAKQFSYAEKKNIPFALVCGEDEKKQGNVTLKDLYSRQNHTGITLSQALEIIRKNLNNPG